MEFNDSPEEAAWRTEVHDFLEKEFPPEFRGRAPRRGAGAAAASEGEGPSEGEGLFPPLVIRMLNVGETTGGLDAALLNVSYFYNRDVKETVGRVQELIQPIMTVVLGAILIGILLMVFSPMYDVIVSATSANKN